MPKSPRKSYLVANWKMHKTIEQALDFIDKIAPIAEQCSSSVLLAVPYTAIKTISDKSKETKLVIGAQNMNDASEGAFTGEVAAVMLKEAGAQFVLIGHSERRIHFKETNVFINSKVKRAVQSELLALLCIGETFEERQANTIEQALTTQLQECLAGLGKEAATSLIIAYEPVWAIGTGLAATPEIAAQAHATIRTVLGTLFGDKEAQKISIIYGGSVTQNNAESFLSAPDIDGLLVGSASLDPESFAKIIAIGQNSPVSK